MRKQDITYQDKLNELKLDISHPNSKGSIFVFLEGESDIRLFRKLFNLDNCKVENIPGGKFKLEECVETLIQNYPLIIGIRDADFMHLGTIPYRQPNLFLTDFHDIEMTLVSENIVFSALISEYTSISKDQHMILRDRVLNFVSQIGFLKWLNDIENLEYNFNVGFIDLLSFLNGGINFQAYFLRMLDKSPNAKITDIAVVLGKIANLKVRNPNLFQLCNGHDTLKVLSEYLRKDHNAILTEKGVASSLRIAFAFEHFSKTGLYRDTKSWADAQNCTMY